VHAKGDTVGEFAGLPQSKQNWAIIRLTLTYPGVEEMSLDPQNNYPIPQDTQRVARAAFPKGNFYMHMRDELGEIYRDANFAELFPGQGQKAKSPGRQAVMQFSEGLSDRQAAEALQARIDWKYVLTGRSGL
jgi:hypothetical protein